MIEVKIIADSISPAGVRLTTMQLIYPRFIHSEFMTHRMFSRNAASSRAIPIKKFLKSVRQNPAMPIWWGKNQSGMQAREELQGWRKWAAMKLWVFACYLMMGVAWAFQKIDLHKQVANRILEPWFHMQTIVTATEWDNFFALRRHKDAQPEIKALADAMDYALQTNNPAPVEEGDYHLPYIFSFEAREYDIETLKKCSVARCCRVSYLTHDGKKPDVKKDIELHDRLQSDGHMSPFEHVAWAARSSYEQSGNFWGWVQYRKEIPNEDVFHG